MAMMSIAIPKAAMAPVKAEREKFKKNWMCIFLAFVDYLKLCSEKENNYVILLLKKNTHSAFFSLSFLFLNDRFKNKPQSLHWQLFCFINLTFSESCFKSELNSVAEINSPTWLTMSSTFYKQPFCTKVWSFLWLCLYILAKGYWRKAARKMLVTLTTDRFNYLYQYWMFFWTFLKFSTYKRAW